MRKPIIALLAVAAVAGAGFALRFAGGPTIAAEAPTPPPVAPGIPVTAGTVAIADVPMFVNGIGTVQAFNMAAIKSRVDGQLMAVQFAEGQEVKAGDQLVQIDPRPYKAAFDQAVANQEKDQANLANAQVNFARDAQLINSNLSVSRQQYDNDKATVAADQAIVDSDKAQVETARLNLEYATITSPISGRLGARLVDVGNLVHASDANPLVTVAQLRPIFVSFTLAQEWAHKVRERQAIEPLAVQAYGGDGKTLLSTGKLTLIDNTIEQTTGTIHLKATFANDDERLWPGEFVNMRVILNVRRGVATVPDQTVQAGPSGQYVYVIDADNKVARRTVEVATVQDGIAVITKGLSNGEKVVVDGQYRLTDGARVNPSQAKEQPSG